MAASRRRGPGGPHLPGHRRPTRPAAGRPPGSQGADDGTGLLDDVAAMLAEPGPWRLLSFASSLLAVLDPRAADPFGHDDEPAGRLTISELAGTFIEVQQRETTALLKAFDQLLPADADEVLRRRIRRELARRDHPLPAWLQDVDPIQVSRAVIMSHVLGDGDNVMLGASTGAGDTLTAVVYIDYNVGGLVKDAFVVDAPLPVVLKRFREITEEDDPAGWAPGETPDELASPETTFADLDLADARARIEEAIEIGAITYPPFETETWPASRPLIERLLRALPEGGTGRQRPEWSEADRNVLITRFLASPHGRAHDHTDGRDLLDALLWFACDYGPGDPLSWSPVQVEILLTDWLPRKVVAPTDFLGRAPDVLRDLIRFCHQELGLRTQLTEETLTAVDEWEPEFRAAIKDPSTPRGPGALLATLLGADEGAWVDEESTPWLDLPREQLLLELLHDTIGDEEQLSSLDDSPLPDEPIDWDAIPADLHDRVGEVAALTDRCCDELLDVEHRTAARRLLADIARGDPAVFRRRSRADTAAAAVVWTIAKANGSLRQQAGGLTAKTLLAWFGLTGSVSQRAATMLKAVGVDTGGSTAGELRLGTPRYLVSAKRRKLLSWRDEVFGTQG